jgi:hypothetical protein
MERKIAPCYRDPHEVDRPVRRPPTKWPAYAASGLRQPSGQECRRRYSESLGELVNVEQRDVPLAALHAAHIVAVQTGKFGQPLLREFSLLAECPQAVAEPVEDVGQGGLGAVGRAVGPLSISATKPSTHFTFANV